jgi:hypothetical protein
MFVRFLKGCITIMPLLSAPSVAVASEPTSVIQNLLIGSWTTNQSNPSGEVEREAIKLKIFGITRYEANGNGFTNLYTYSPCGQLVRHHVFRWSVNRGILITDDGEAISRDRILRITNTQAILIALNDPSRSKEYRLKLSEGNCR